MGRDDHDYHADGEKDAVEGEYHPPHSINIVDSFVLSEHTWDKCLEDNEQYDKGYENAQKQK